MRILLVYPGHGYSTIDVADGYCEALRDLGHDVFRYEYHNVLAFYTKALEACADMPGIFNPGDANMVLASERLVISVMDTRPDAILIVNGMSLHGRGMVLARALGVPIGLVLTESPYNDDWQFDQLKTGLVDVAFANDKSSVLPLSVSGCKVVYLPHSFNPQRHRPIENVPEMYQTDVFFHGTLWPERQRLFSALDLSPYHAHIGGIQPMRKEIDGEVIQNAYMPRWYSGAKIVLNLNRTIASSVDGKETHVKNAYSLGPRAFEVAACGAFQLCDNQRPELYEVFGDSVATFASADDLQDKIDYFMAHESERQEMAQEARRRVQSCSFAQRATDIVLPHLDMLM